MNYVISWNVLTSDGTKADVCSWRKGQFTSLTHGIKYDFWELLFSFSSMLRTLLSFVSSK
jgi:hypothetical protein